MPYVKPPKVPFEAVTRLIRGYGYTGATLAAVLDCTPPTARNKLDHPANLTLGDLDRINRFGHIPLNEIREAIQN